MKIKHVLFRPLPLWGMTGAAVLLLAGIFSLTGCPNPADSEPPASTTYTVAQTGGVNATADSTGIAFTFSADVTGLTANDITLTNGTGAVTKGTLTGNGKNWSLAITVTMAGTVKVKITRDGIESREKEVTVFKQASSTRERMGSGKIGNTSTRRNIRNARNIRAAVRAVLEEAESENPFVLDMLPDEEAPENMVLLEGEVEFGDYVIVLEGLLDEESGWFVAAGVDSEALGVGYQIEGFYRDGALEDVTVTVKAEDMVTHEWVEEEVTPWLGLAEVTATETVDHQEPGLPASLWGKYKFTIGPDSWADSIDDFYAKPYPGNPVGTDGITLGAAVGDILADDNAFVLVAPMAWSVVIDYNKITPLIRAELTSKGFSDVSEAMELLYKRLGYFEEFYYCSFLEVEQETAGASDAYYALSFFNVLSLDPDVEDKKVGEWFTRFKIYMFETETLILAQARDLQYNPWGPDYDPITGVAQTAEEARQGSTFTDTAGADPGITWMFMK